MRQAALLRLARGVTLAWLWACTACAGAPIAAPRASDAAAGEARAEVMIQAADIPARADQDEQFVQAVVRRAQTADAAKRLARSLAQQTAAIQQLGEQTDADVLAALSSRRLESERRHWQLFSRQLSAWRASLQRATQASSEDAAALASRRMVWTATAEAAVGSTPALLQRTAELIVRIEGAERTVSGPLARLLELGSQGNALSARVQSALTGVAARIREEDRRLLAIDAPAFWQLGDAAEMNEGRPIDLKASLLVETTLARDYDAANSGFLGVFVVLCLILLPLLLWLSRRSAQATAVAAPWPVVQALSRPWATWLVLAAAGMVAYDLQGGPVLRQQTVMLLAWGPILRLLPRPLPARIGPCAYVCAAFYCLNVSAAFLIGDPIAYRSMLFCVDLLLGVALVTLLIRARSAGAGATGAGDPPPKRRQLVRAVVGLGAGLAFVAAFANLLGNEALPPMLTNAILDSSYMAFALYAGATVVAGLLRTLLGRPSVTLLARGHASSLIRVGARLVRLVLILGWAAFTLKALRIDQPLIDLVDTIFKHDFKLGLATISLGGALAFFGSTWLAFWLARNIRLLLAEDIMPALSLPRGVGNSISTLSYYSILFVGLITALMVAGFEAGQFAIVFGALGVGIGFGLQDIVKNIVSGLILMFERPIQPGDVVDIAGMSGTVRDIGMRTTTITTFDGADVVVPNGMLLADKLVNWTLNRNSRRIDLNVSTGYGVAPQQTIALLVATATALDGIAVTPPPIAIVTGLGRDALEFNLRAWTTEKSDWIVVRSNLAMGVRDALAGAGIEVPRPQSELFVSAMSELGPTRTPPSAVPVK